MNKKVVFHVPHDGNCFPNELMSAVCVPMEEFYRYHTEMRDYGARCFIPPLKNRTEICFEISRLLCDVERFIGAGEIMEKYGMGFCYEKVYDGTVIKQVSESLKAKTFAYYQDHHNKLNDEVKNYKGEVVFVDLHSFSEKVIVADTLGKIEPLPDFCIGYDEFLSAQQRMKIVNAFQKAGYRVAENYPYAGSLVPNAVLKGEATADIASFMIEVNKAVYLSDNNEIDFTVAAKIQNVIGEILQNF